MDKYISANNLIYDIERSRADNNHNNTIASQTHIAEHRHFIKMVLDQPAANVVENEADLVKVVRCNQCKHSRPINRTKAPEKYFRDECVVCECEDVVGDEPMIYLGSHFCGCGKRK
jgi:hypothetical protein